MAELIVIATFSLAVFVLLAGVIVAVLKSGERRSKDEKALTRKFADQAACITDTFLQLKQLELAIEKGPLPPIPHPFRHEENGVLARDPDEIQVNTRE